MYVEKETFTPKKMERKIFIIALVITFALAIGVGLTMWLLLKPDPNIVYLPNDYIASDVLKNDLNTTNPISTNPSSVVHGTKTSNPWEYPYKFPLVAETGYRITNITSGRIGGSTASVLVELKDAADEIYVSHFTAADKSFKVWNPVVSVETFGATIVQSMLSPEADKYMTTNTANELDLWSWNGAAFVKDATYTANWAGVTNPIFTQIAWDSTDNTAVFGRTASNHFAVNVAGVWTPIDDNVIAFYQSGNGLAYIRHISVDSEYFVHVMNRDAPWTEDVAKKFSSIADYDSGGISGTSKFNNVWIDSHTDRMIVDIGSLTGSVAVHFNYTSAKWSRVHAFTHGTGDFRQHIYRLGHHRVVTENGDITFSKHDSPSSELVAPNVAYTHGQNWTLTGTEDIRASRITFVLFTASSPELLINETIEPSPNPTARAQLNVFIKNII